MDRKRACLNFRHGSFIEQSGGADFVRNAGERGSDFEVTDCVLDREVT